MPALLSDAYGPIFAQELQRTITKQLMKPQSSLGAVVSTDGHVSTTSTTPVRHTRPTWGEKNGNYEIHITIDRHDCHLLCLFIGVFALCVLFNSNKQGKSSLVTA